MTPGARVRVLGHELVGFDDFMQWYADRREAQGPSFGYEVEELLDGQQHAGAILRLKDADRTWRQVVVYRIEGGAITDISAYEDEPTATL